MSLLIRVLGSHTQLNDSPTINSCSKRVLNDLLIYVQFLHIDNVNFMFLIDKSIHNP